MPLSEGKDTARRMLAKLAGDSQLAGVGIADPFARHRARPCLEHLEDFRRNLDAKGNTADMPGRRRQAAQRFSQLGVADVTNQISHATVGRRPERFADVAAVPL